MPRDAVRGAAANALMQRVDVALYVAKSSGRNTVMFELPPPIENRPAPPSEEAVIARLSHWRAPTDSLLHAPGDPLLRGVPRLGASSIDGNLYGNFNGGNESK